MGLSPSNLGTVNCVEVAEPFCGNWCFDQASSTFRVWRRVVHTSVTTPIFRVKHRARARASPMFARLLLAGAAALASGMQMSADMSLELQTQATATMMIEEAPVTLDPDVHERMSCPMSKVGCPLCYDIVEQWNELRNMPEHADTYCSGVVSEKWSSRYQMLTGKPVNEAREKTRCMAIVAGVHEVVKQGCELGSCPPHEACSAFCS